MTLNLPSVLLSIGSAVSGPVGPVHLKSYRDAKLVASPCEQVDQTISETGNLGHCGR